VSHLASLALLAQVPPAGAEHGWLTTKLLSVTLTSSEWVLWILAAASVVSVAIILERIVFFASHRISSPDEVLRLLTKGDFEGAKRAVTGSRGMEAEVVRQGIGAAQLGPHAVEEVIASAVARERPRYERFLSFLGTAGTTAPFVGLFGTVLGIIMAFHDLGRIAVKGAAIQQTVMTGISEALVATAVGLAVAIPAVVAYNVFTRWLKTMTASANALSHALVGHLHGVSETATQPAPGAAPAVRAAAVVREA